MIKNKKYSLTDKIKIRYDYYKTGLIDNKNNYTIDKVFNLLSVEEIIMNILKLRDIKIKNNKINNCLVKLNDIDLETYKIEGLDILVNLFRPLYDYQETKEYEEKIQELLNELQEYPLYLDFIEVQERLDTLFQKVRREITSCFDEETK